MVIYGFKFHLKMGSVVRFSYFVGQVCQKLYNLVKKFRKRLFLFNFKLVV